MKIGYLIPEFPGQTHAFFWRELTAMETMDADISVFSTRRPKPEACPHGFREAATRRTTYLFPPCARSYVHLLLRPLRLARALVYVLGLNETSLKRRLALTALIPTAAELVAHCHNSDIRHVHIHSCANAAHLGALANILADLSYSLTLHGDLPVYGTDHTHKMARAAFVSAVTRPLAEDIHSLMPDLHAPVIWMGVDTDVFSPTSKAMRSPDAPFHVVTVARLNRTKGHNVFLQAMALCRDKGMDVKYTIIGEGDARPAIETEIVRLELKDHVTMTGMLGEIAIRDALAQCDALALTSFGQGEAAPVTVMEAMASGLPTIVSRIGGTGDMIDHGCDGLLTAQQDVASVAEALQQLITAPDRAREMGRAARETALRKFDYRSRAQALLHEIYSVYPK